VVGVRSCFGGRLLEPSILQVDFYAPLRYRAHYPLYARPLISSAVHTFIRWDSPAPHVRVLAHDLTVGRFSVILLTYILPSRYFRARPSSPSI